MEIKDLTRVVDQLRGTAYGPVDSVQGADKGGSRPVHYPPWLRGGCNLGSGVVEAALEQRGGEPLLQDRLCPVQHNIRMGSKGRASVAFLAPSASIMETSSSCPQALPEVPRRS